MNREEIKKLIPHREPMLLIDEAENIDGVAHAKYHVRGDEFFLQGHFPGNPVVPGVILCEILAQSACVLLMGGEGTPLYSGLDKVRFKRPVRPGDTLSVTCSLKRSMAPFHFCEAEGRVGDEVAVTASFSFAIVNGEE